jgi:hypothetical protein
MSESHSSIRTDGILNRAMGIADGRERRDLDFARSAFVYRSLFDDLASPQRLGLSEEDLAMAWADERAVTIRYEVVGGEEVDLPLLIPADRLYWYNEDFFSSYYGQGTPILYYSHVPLSLGGPPGGQALERVAEHLARGAILIADGYLREGVATEFDTWRSALHSRFPGGVTVESPHGGAADAVLNQFVATLTFDGATAFRPSASFYEHYREALMTGEFSLQERGVEIATVIDDHESEHLWSIYEGPFDAISGGQVLRAGFDRRAFLDVLRDPEVVKVVRRREGGIATLCMFVTNLRRCPWLSVDYYQETLRDAHSTDNILVFTGVVSDKSLRGQSYAHGLLTALAQLVKRRGTACVITFECNGISSAYVPQIVERAIREVPGAAVSGLAEPVSQLAFRAIRAMEPDRHRVAQASSQ